MRVAIIGSRNCGDFPIERMDENVPADCTLIVSGGAEGIDRMAEDLAQRRRVPLRRILPQYEVYGKHAPVMRNVSIITQADLVLAFWDFHSRGTASAIAECIGRGIPVKVIGLGAADPFTHPDLSK